MSKPLPSRRKRSHSKTPRSVGESSGSQSRSARKGRAARRQSLARHRAAVRQKKAALPGTRVLLDRTAVQSESPSQFEEEASGMEVVVPEAEAAEISPLLETELAPAADSRESTSEGSESLSSEEARVGSSLETRIDEVDVTERPSRDTMRVSLRAPIESTSPSLAEQAPAPSSKPSQLTMRVGLKAVADQLNQRPSHQTMRVSLKAPSAETHGESENEPRAVRPPRGMRDTGKVARQVSHVDLSQSPEESSPSDTAEAQIPGPPVPKPMVAFQASEAGTVLQKETMRVSLRAPAERPGQPTAEVPTQPADAPASSNPFIQNTRVPGSVVNLTGPVTQQAPPSAPHPSPVDPGLGGNSVFKDVLIILAYTAGFLGLLLLIWFLVIR